MHHRTFARVAPARAKLFFYVCAAVACFLAWRLVRGAGHQRPALRARGAWRSVPTRSKSSRAAAASSIATATCWCARFLGERLRGAARYRRSRRYRRKTADDLRQARSSVQSPQLHDQAICGSCGSRARCRTTSPIACAPSTSPACRLKGRRTGTAHRYRRHDGLDPSRLRRHRRKRARRHRVRVRRHVARSLRPRDARDRRVRPADSVRARDAS